MTRVSVLIAHQLGLLTYRAETALAPGTIVAAPLGNRAVMGVVWDDPADEAVPAEKLKVVSALSEDLSFDGPLRRFIDFVAAYTLAPRGAVLKLTLRGPEALEAVEPAKGLTLTGLSPGKWTPARERVRAALAAGPMPRARLGEVAGVSSAIITGMLKAGALAQMDLPEALPAEPKMPELSADQNAAAEALSASIGEGFSVTLLNGVTGSGKTAVYLEAVAAALAAGRQALVLMPEIALTPMVVARLTERLGHEPAEWHSGRTPAARNAVWRQVADGSASVVVGARSALFLPFRDLGLVVVDEEHDASFKQEDGVVYHARDMAIARAQAASAPVVLASATPSIETQHNAARGRYRVLALPDRVGGAALPDIGLIDLRQTPPPKGEWLAPPVRAAVTQTLSAGYQVLLFLNRRGYAPLTVCRKCGHRMLCPNCSASLVEHRLRGTLVCHHCGYFEKKPDTCSACGAVDSLTPCGPGVERVEEEARAVWPDARVLTLSSDMAGGPAELSAALDRASRGEADIIVGTQLVAKGFTLPKLQLVVVVDGDLGLASGDPRAGERTFQLLTQVTGRAGRVTSGGRALIQTHAPEHPAIAAMARQDAEAFYAEEMLMRRDGWLPPFVRLAAIIVSALDRQQAVDHAQLLARTAPDVTDLEVLGPAEAPMAILRGRYRFRLLIRAPRTMKLQSILGEWLAAAPITGTVRRSVDIDPQSFL